MNCLKCAKNHATVHITEVRNGVKKVVHLCEECARAAGGEFTFSITDILDKIHEPPKGGGKSGQAGDPRPGL